MPIRTTTVVARRVRAVSNVAGMSLDEGWAAPLIAVLALYAVAYGLLTLLHPFDEETFLALSDLGGVVPPVLAGLLALAAADNANGQVRLAWTLIGGACLAWGFGEITWTVYEVGLDRETPFPSIADAGYLAMLPLMALGLTLLSSSRRTIANTRPALDGVVIALAFTAFVWFFVLHPTYSDSAASALEKVIGGLYPLGDLVLLYVLVVAVERHVGFRESVVLTVMLAAILLLIAADVGFAYLTLNDRYSATSLVNVGWPFGFLCLAYAAALSARWGLGFADDEEATSARLWQEALPALVVPPMAVLAVLAVVYEPRSTSVPLFALASAASVAVLLRAAVGLVGRRRIETSREKLSRFLTGRAG
jgi:hypothetical protein